MARSELLRLDRVTKRYSSDGPPAVDGLVLGVEEGEILALLGPSGCGKTTTLRLIAGLRGARCGHGGDPRGGHGRRGRRVPPERAGVGIVFQDYALFPHLTVAENVGFGLQVGDGPSAPGAPASARASSGSRRSARGTRTSCRAGSSSGWPWPGRWPPPRLLLLDEPFSNLDADLRAQMRDEVETVLRTTRTTAVFVTHDQEEAFTLADQVGVLHQAGLEQLGVARDDLPPPGFAFVAEFVGAADFLPGIVTTEGIVTELGVFGNVDGPNRETQVRVMIRPDDIDLRARTAWVRA